MKAYIYRRHRVASNSISHGGRAVTRSLSTQRTRVWLRVSAMGFSSRSILDWVGAFNERWKSLSGSIYQIQYHYLSLGGRDHDSHATGDVLTPRAARSSLLGRDLYTIAYSASLEDTQLSIPPLNDIYHIIHDISSQTVDNLTDTWQDKQTSESHSK